MSKIEYYNNIRNDVLSALPDKKYKNILEIGGGEFETLSLLAKKNDSEAWGVDLYPCGNSSIKFICGSFESEEITAKLPEEYFHLIMANDVLEHIVDTEKFFETTHKKLIRGGLLVLSVPNVRQLRLLYHIYLKGSFPREDAGLFDKTHMRWFCKKDVENLGSKYLKLLNSKSIGRLVPGIFSQSLFGELLGLQNIFIFIKD